MTGTALALPGKPAALSLRLKRALRKYRLLYLMLTPILLYYLVFHYLPMLGVVIAFQDFRPARGILAGEWVGLKHFISFFSSEFAFRTIRNTLSISVLGLAFGFPAPILLALMINEVRSKYFMKTVQTITYMPHFISTVVICSIVIDFVSTKGLLNELLGVLGLGSIKYASDPNCFYPTYIISGIWQHMGWDSIIYLAALSGIDTELYEAATVDGAGRFKRIWHITLPGILPTISILLILNLGNLMSVGYEKILLMYNPALYEKADVISTYVYRRGMEKGEYSFAAAVGLFNSAVNFILLIASDKISKKLGQSGLF